MEVGGGEMGPGFFEDVILSTASKIFSPGALQRWIFGLSPGRVSGLKLLQLLQFLHFVMEAYLSRQRRLLLTTSLAGKNQGFLFLAVLILSEPARTLILPALPGASIRPNGCDPLIRSPCPYDGMGSRCRM